MEVAISKVLKTAAIVVGAVALAATGVGLAVGAAAAASMSVAGMSLATFATAASVASGALSVAAGLTAKKPQASVSGSQTTFSANPDDGLPLVLGRTGYAGKIIRRVGFDTRDEGDNDRQSFVVALSLGLVAAIEGQTVDQAPVSYTAGGAAIGAYAGWMWSKTQLGQMSEPALSFGDGAGSPPGWGASYRLSGLAAATWTLRFDTKGKMFQAGVPAPIWTVRGALCYDPTKDSTYPGGSGPHRMADPADTAAYDAAVATWEWSDNPYLLGLRWAHGVWLRDRDNPASQYQRVMGIGAPWTTIDVPAFVEGRNIAKANGWTAGGVAYSTDGKWDTLKAILQAGMGEPLALGARISCLVNSPKVSLATIGIDDVVGKPTVSATQSRRDRINTITPRYRLEANNWKFLPGAPISVAQHVAFDKGKRSRLQDYPFIQNTPQAATAVRYDIENAREFGPIVLPLKLVWMGYKPGDCVTVTLPELGLNGQPILLLNRSLSPADGIVTMTARSETAEKHPFALGQTTVPPPTPGVTGAPVIPVPRDGSWAISGTSIISADATVPALIVTGATDAATVEAVVLEYRAYVSGQSPGAGWISAGVFEPSLTRLEIVSVQGGTPYEVAVSYQRKGFTGDRRIIGPVVTGGTALDFGAVTGPTKPEDNATVGAPGGTPVGDLTGKLVADAMKAMSDGVDVSDVVEGARDVAAEARQAAAAARELTGAAKGDIAAAIAGARDLVGAGRGNATAALANQLLQQARKDRFEQLAHLDGLPMGTVVKREVIERKEGEAQIVGTIELIGHKTEDAEGFILNTQTVMVAPGQSLGEKFTAIIAEVAGPNGPIQAVATELTQAIADEREARALALTDLQTEITGPNGPIQAIATDLTEAISTEQEARALALLDLKAEIVGEDGTRLALATDLTQAISTEQEARALALLDLKAEIEGEDGTRLALATDLTQAMADEREARALALTDLRTEIVGPNGPVTAINTRLDEAFSGEEGSFARSITDLASKVDGQEASVELLLETVNGETANAQLVTNVNGHITGFRINGQESLFFVAADRFVVGEDQVFEVVNGETRTKNLRVGGDLVIDGSLKIGKLDRSTMSSYSHGEATGFFGDFNSGVAYVPNLGASMPIGDAGTLYLSFTGYSGNTNSAITANYNSIEILDAAGAVLQSVRLPYGVNNRLENYLVRIPNTWGARTIQWRVATRGNDLAYSNINDPNVTVNWSML